MNCLNSLERDSIFAYFLSLLESVYDSKQWVDGSEEREELFVIIKEIEVRFSYFENVLFCG